VSAITISGLTKTYGQITAVDDLCLEIASGEIFVLLGPNGAGKTTTVEIVEGLRSPDSGDVDVLGAPPGARDIAPRVGVMPQQTDLYAGIRAEEALHLFASFYENHEEPDALIERLDLDRVRKTTYRRLSGGERRRLSLALALVGRPEVAFLDEPTAEMDVEGRAKTWEIVREMKGRGATVLLTTHLLDEAERVADRVAIMRDGKLVACGTPEELASSAPRTLRFRTTTPIDAGVLSSALGSAVTEDGTRSYQVAVEPTPLLISRLTTWLAARGVLLLRLDTGPRSLEDVYLEHTT
jgi:ABC-2 type transport system ATP-binding protein